MRRLLAVLALAAAPAFAAPVRDAGREQFPAQAGDNEAESGFFDVGTYAQNQRGAAAARPDGTGAAIMNDHVYADDSMLGDKLQFVGDGVFLTDDRAPRSYLPASADYLFGVAIRSDHMRLQFDREESLAFSSGDGGGYRNWDARLSALFHGGADPGGKTVGSSVDAALTAGYFLFPGYTPARLDGAGQAQFHYIGTVQANLGGYVLLRADADMLTDRYSRKYLPSDLDMDLGVGGAYRNFELMLHRRFRRTIGGPGYAAYDMVTARVRFSYP